MLKLARQVAATLLLLTASLAAHAQTSRPITIVVPFGAGGSTDAMARIIAPRIATALNRTVIVDNKPGAGTRLAAGLVKDMAADGTVMLMALPATASIAPALYPGQVKYDFRTDYTPVAQVAKHTIVLVVSENSKFTSTSDLIAYARQSPGRLNIGTSGVGTMGHLSLYRLEKATGMKTTMIPFRGGSSVISDLIGGQIDAAVDTLGEFVEHHRAKKMRILGVFSAARSSVVPDAPTMKEQGIDLESENWYGLFVPSKTPKSTVTELQEAVATAVRDPDVQARLNSMAMRPSYLNGPDLGKMLINDAASWGAVVRESGIKVD